MLDEKILREKIEELKDKYHVAGMAVSVTDREKVVYAEGFGMENVEYPERKITTETMFRIASVTKIVAATMIMRMVEEGLLELDKLVKEYLPELVLSRPEALEEMTLRHLLTHTAGLPTDGVIPEGSRDESAIGDNIARTFPHLEIAHLPSESVFGYANMGFTLAGHIASKLTGKTISELFEEYVLEPLGMERSTMDFYKAATWPFSQPHEPDGDSWTVTHYQRINTLYSAGGGIHSNAMEMAKLARFLLNRGVTDSGERLLSEASIDQMFEKHSVWESEHGDFYGMGIHIHNHKCSQGVRCFYGHCGNYHPYHSSVFVDPKTGYGVSVLMNTAAEPLQCGMSDALIELLEAVD